MLICCSNSRPGSGSWIAFSTCLSPGHLVFSTKLTARDHWEGRVCGRSFTNSQHTSGITGIRCRTKRSVGQSIFWFQLEGGSIREYSTAKMMSCLTKNTLDSYYTTQNQITMRLPPGIRFAFLQTSDTRSDSVIPYRMGLKATTHDDRQFERQTTVSVSNNQTKSSSQRYSRGGRERKIDTFAIN